MIDVEHIPHLENLATGGIMRKVVPPHIESVFLENGYARKTVGGLCITDSGRKLFMDYQKK